jgi:hypothetical protein
MPWHYYCTLTFPTHIDRSYARRLFKRWIRHLNEHYLGRRYRRQHRGIKWALAEEYQLRGVIHFHCLLYIPPGQSQDGLAQWVGVRAAPHQPGPDAAARIQLLWQFRTAGKICGFADIKPYDPERKAGAYLSKYITKGGYVDFYL